MKKLIILFLLFINGFASGQSFIPKYFLSKIVYDSITKDQFLFDQKYADFSCGTFTISAEMDMKQLDAATWLFKQDFSQYLDTTNYTLHYEAISYENGFHFEFFQIYAVNSTKMVRQLMASYEINSNLLVGILDSDIGW